MIDYLIDIENDYKIKNNLLKQEITNVENLISVNKIKN